MSVHCLPDGRFICKFPSGTIPDQPKKTKLYFGRGPEAERAAHDYNDSLGVGKHPRQKSPTFATLALAYLEAKTGIISASTEATWLRRMAGTIIPAIGDTMAHHITPSYLDGYAAERLKSVKRNTLHRELTDIRSKLRWAVRRKMLAANPMADYEMPKKSDLRIRPPSKTEIEAILAHSVPHLRRAILLSYNTGLRPGGELFSLTWDSVDLIGKTIVITSALKGGLEQRILPISASFANIMAQWLQEDEKAGMRYLVHFRGGKVGNVQAAWKNAKKRAKITRRLRLYDLRHCFASLLISRGADIRSVSELLGHRSVSMTLSTYAHVSGDLKRAAVALLDDVGTQGPNQ